MSMLSTFAILFETDSKKAAKETDEFAESLDDVEKSAEGATGGVDGTTKAYNQNSVSVGALTKSIVGLVGGLIAFDAIASKVFDNATQIDTIGKLSQTIGLNIVELDAWGEAAARNGGSAEALRGTVESLQTSLQDIEITGGGEIVNTLAMIGIQATKANGEIKSAFEILPEIAKAFEGMSTEKSFAFGKRLGLDQGTILTLQQSRHEIDKLVERQKMLGGVTKEGYENAAKFNDQWDDTKRVFNSLWMSSNNTILPMLQNILKGAENIIVWFRENQWVFDGLFYSFNKLAEVVGFLGKALAILDEDRTAWVKGLDSATGRLVGTFEDLKKTANEVFETLKDGWNSVTDWFKADVNVNHKMNAGSGLMPSNTEMAQMMISKYSSTNLNHGGATSNQRTQHNTISIGGANVDARGMSGSQAKSVINESMKESVEMAIGQLADGVER